MSEKIIRKEITVYKGILECQFSDIKKNPLGYSKKNSRIKLEPRFKLHNAEIVEVFPIVDDYKDNIAYIHQRDDLFSIECYFKSKKIKPGRYVAEEVMLLLKSNSFDASENNIGDFNKVLLENINKKTSEPFLSTNIDKQHGKISGDAYLKVVRIFDENNEEIKYTTSPSGKVELAIQSENTGCMPFYLFFARIFKYIFDFNSKIKNYINNISSRVFNKKLIDGGNEGNPGCLNSMLPTGCTSSGCSQFGCGCLSLLLALAFLFWFIWCLILGKCNHDSQNSNSTKVIHDTVYVEVNKTKVDTIVKNDTIVYEDKTTRTKTSLVRLPNVQFEKNKAKLLDSSKEDLDNLSKYLNENKQVKAEIIGHTDGSGDDNANQILSQDRAESVRQYLIKKGVEPNRINAVGKGESVPRSTNETLEGRAMNRRVEVKLSQTEKVEQTKRRIKKETN
jgi:outer membrane protein OmpA-like peptidoglycan-associated protein